MSTRFIRNPRLREALINAYAVEGSGDAEVKALQSAIDTTAFFMTDAQRAHEQMVAMRSEFTKLPTADLKEQIAILTGGLSVVLSVLGVDQNDVEELREQGQELSALPLVEDIELTQLLIKVGYCAVADSNDSEIDTLREAVEHAVDLLGQHAANDVELAQSLQDADLAAHGDYNDPEIESLQEALRTALRLLGAKDSDVQTLREEGERRWDEE